MKGEWESRGEEMVKKGERWVESRGEKKDMELKKESWQMQE